MGLPDGGIPEDKLPQCWSDDVRMNALFAPFRLRTANPESWEMKMNFWPDLLRLWCRCKKDPIVSAADARVAFQRKGRTPACTDIVIEELLRSGELAPLSKYHQILHNGPEGWVKWGARLAFRPAAFALTAMTSLLPARQAIDNDGLPKASIDVTQRFVLESAVKEQAIELLQNYPPGVERMGTIEELMKNCEWTGNRDTFELLLGYLVSQGSAVKKDDVVKLAEPDKKASPVTDSDEALVKLVSAETRLEGDAQRLSRDVLAAETDARAALQLGNKLVAKNHLRRKHKAAQRLDKCTAALENVRQLLQQLRDVDVNAAIVHTYRTTSEAMKKGMKDNGLEEDSVHDTMDDLREVMDTYNEVGKALGGTVEDFDAAELEQELKELLAGPGAPGGGTPGKEERRDAPTLPTPPRSKINKKSEDFVFDGEERVLAELNELGIEDASPKLRAARSKGQVAEVKVPKKVAVTELWEEKDEKPTVEPKPKPSKPWYPPKSSEMWSNNNDEEDYELRQDDRLHPGQPLNVDFTTPPRLYNRDMQVRDHKMAAGVWLYNTRDNNSNLDCDLAASTEYISSESPGKSSGNFQMAPGGERHVTHPWPQDEPTAEPSVEDLQRRLNNLRGLHL